MKKSRIAMTLVLLAGVLAVDGSLEARQDDPGVVALSTTATPTLLKDLNVTPSSSEVRILQSIGSTTYFQVATGTYGRELWKTDGTAGGTVRVKVITSDASRTYGAAIAESVVVGQKIFFTTAVGGAFTYKLWVSDGTEAGTRQVAGLDGYDRIETLTAHGDRVFFSLSADNEFGYSDGTESGTGTISQAVDAFIAFDDEMYVVKDSIRKVSADLSGTTLIATLGSRVSLGPVAMGPAFYLITSDGSLWRSDGTAATALTDVSVPGGGSDEELGNTLTSIGDRLYFSVGGDLWSSEGTGASEIVDFNTNSFGEPDYFTGFNGSVYFSAYDTTHGVELWKWNGTTASRVKDIRTGSASSSPMGLTVVGNELLFNAGELWKTDGTEVGTVMVKDIALDEYQRSSEFAVVGTSIRFGANDGDNGFELWTSDGTEAGTRLIKDIGTSTGSAFRDGGGDGFAAPFTQGALVGESYLFAANTSGNIWNRAQRENSLWKTDGTSAGTVLVKDLSPNELHGNIVRIGNIVVFGVITYVGDNENHELWKSDGTTAGTVKISDMETRYLTAFKDVVLFSTTTPAAGWELWKTDGTTAGTTLVKDINPGAGNSNPFDLRAVGNTMYFNASNGTAGAELWKSDGTAEGTLMVKDIRPGSESGYPYMHSVVGETLFFHANDGTHSEELWKTDGTAEGTLMVKDISAGPGSSTTEDRAGAVVGGTLFFTAGDNENGYELWKTDGTSAGTVMVTDIDPGGPSSWPRDMVALGGQVYFFAAKGNLGYELWKSDGTAEGTAMVKDINPEPGETSVPNGVSTDMMAVGPRLFFSATDGTNGYELWKSDGTSAGTAMVADLNSAGSSHPSDMTAIGDLLLFAAQTQAYGWEPWVVDAAVDDTMTWAPVTAIKTTESPYTFAGATATSRAAMTYAVADAGTTGCSIAEASRPVLNFTAAGSCTVRASTVKTAGYRQATASVTFVIAAVETPTTLAPTTTTAVPAKVLPGLTMKKPVTVKALLKYYGITPPKKSTTSIRVRSSSKKVCQATKAGLRALKPGRCGFTLTVQPPATKKGKLPKAIKRTGILIATRR